MIVIKDIVYTTKESLLDLSEKMYDFGYKEEHIEIFDMYRNFLMDCYEADSRLNEMVFDSLGENFISFVILPLEDTELLDAFSFKLANYDNSKIKMRDEMTYKNLCDICFGGVKPFYNRIIEYYEEKVGEEP